MSVPPYYLPYGSSGKGGGSDYVEWGSVDFARVYHPRVKGRRIWLAGDWDAYFNVCLNGNRKLYSKGGQRYCWATFGHPAYWKTSMSHWDNNTFGYPL